MGPQGPQGPEGPAGDTSLIKGMIIMWSGEIGSDGHPIIDGVPNIDWYICDGRSGTPDLTNRFIIGAGGTYSVGQTGGNDYQTLTMDNLPEHMHSVGLSTNGNEDGRHFHQLYDNYVKVAEGGLDTIDWGDYGSTYQVAQVTKYTQDLGHHSHTIDGYTDATGNGEPFSIQPSYYAMTFLMYIPE